MVFWRLKSWLGFKIGPSRSRPCGAPESAATDRQRLLREAVQRRDDLASAMMDAERRGDDREFGRFRMAHCEATSDLLRLEVGR